MTAGLPAPDALSRISPLAIIAESRSIVGPTSSPQCQKVDIPHYEQWWREGKLPVEKLISHHIHFEDTNQAMDDLSGGKAQRQIILFDRPVD